MYNIAITKTKVVVNDSNLHLLLRIATLFQEKSATRTFIT